MTVQQLIMFAITASLLMLVFSLGLKATKGDLLYLANRPGKLVRSITSMNIIMPLFAICVALFLPLAIEIEIALIALAVAPVPPVLPGKQAKAGGTQSFAISLLAAAAIAAIFLVPISIEIVGYIFHSEIHMPASRVIPPVLTTVIAPLFAGMIFCRWWPETAARIARPISLIATVLLLAAALPILVTTGISFWAQIGNGVVACLALFTVLGLCVGHLLGGPEQDDRTVLALATGTRHPGVAIAIAGLNFPDNKAVIAVMLWHLVIGAIVSIPYVRWRKARHRKVAGAQQGSHGSDVK